MAEIIRRCTDTDLHAIFEIINDAASAYKGVIPPDRWHDPYMSQDQLRHEIDAGVRFWGLDNDNELAGVMGIQNKGEVTLLRHAYVRTALRNKGIGSRLLKHLEPMSDKPILIGTWAAASWAVQFYQKNGYCLVSIEEKNRLLRQYWSIPERQVETSVVLANRPYTVLS
jgi:N-acetylglutamate synthase-like GNAT family acetyltransferase